MNNMYELTTDVDTLGLQSVAEMPALGRYRHHRSRRKSVCLVTANHSLNGVNVLNILNFFG
jgi:hypothetical protein